MLPKLLRLLRTLRSKNKFTLLRLNTGIDELNKYYPLKLLSRIRGFFLSQNYKYDRVLLKISGEALMGSKPYGIDTEMTARIAGEVKDAHAKGLQIALVIGAGNIFRGLSAAAGGIERSTADYMGMLATVMNSLAMQSALEQIGVHTRVQSAIPMPTVCEPYIRRKAVRHMEKGRVVIFAGGTGNPYFTTDTAAALRAAEMECDALLKGTQVDGVYDSDPKKNPDAERFETLSYHKVLTDDLKVMDAAAITLMRENNIPIIVFSLHDKGGFDQVMRGKGTCTTIRA